MKVQEITITSRSTDENTSQLMLEGNNADTEFLMNTLVNIIKKVTEILMSAKIPGVPDEIVKLHIASAIAEGLAIADVNDLNKLGDDEDIEDMRNKFERLFKTQEGEN